MSSSQNTETTPPRSPLEGTSEAKACFRTHEADENDVPAKACCDIVDCTEDCTYEWDQGVISRVAGLNFWAKEVRQYCHKRHVAAPVGVDECTIEPGKLYVFHSQMVPLHLRRQRDDPTYPVPTYPDESVVVWRMGQFGKAWKKFAFRVGRDFVNYRGTPFDFIDPAHRPTMAVTYMECGQSEVGRNVLANFGDPGNRGQFLHWLRITTFTQDTAQMSRFASLHKRSRAKLEYERRRFRGTPSDNRRLGDLLKATGLLCEYGQAIGDYNPMLLAEKLRNAIARLGIFVENVETVAEECKRTAINVNNGSDMLSDYFDSLQQEQNRKQTPSRILYSILEKLSFSIARYVLFNGYIIPSKRSSYFWISLGMDVAQMVTGVFAEKLMTYGSKAIGAVNAFNGGYRADFEGYDHDDDDDSEYEYGECEEGQGSGFNILGDVVKWIGSIVGLSTMEKTELARLKDNIWIANNLGKTMENFVNLVLTVCRKAVELFMGRDARIDQYGDLIGILEQRNLTYDAADTDSLGQEMALHAQGVKMLKELPHDDRKHGILQKELNSMSRNMELKRREIKKQPQKKINPVTVYIYGAPGVGKSTATLQLPEGVYGALEEEFCKYKHVYQKRSTTSEFIDGYIPALHKVCVIEDFGLTTDSNAVRSDSNFFGRAATDIPYCLPQADLTDKAVIWMSSEIIIVNSNRPLDGHKNKAGELGRYDTKTDVGLTNAFYSIDAFKRRFDFIYEMKIERGTKKRVLVDHNGKTINLVTAMADMTELLEARRKEMTHDDTLGETIGDQVRRCMFKRGLIAGGGPIIHQVSESDEASEVGHGNGPSEILGDMLDGIVNMFDLMPIIRYMRRAPVTCAAVALFVVGMSVIVHFAVLFNRRVVEVGYDAADNILVMQADKFVRNRFAGMLVDECVKGPHSHHCGECGNYYTHTQTKCEPCDKHCGLDIGQSVSQAVQRPLRVTYNKGEFGQALEGVSEAATFFSTNYGDPNVINVARVIAKNQFQFSTKDGNIGKGFVARGRLCAVVKHTLPITGGGVEVTLDFYNLRNVTFVLKEENTYCPEGTDVMYFLLPKTVQQFSDISKHFSKTPMSSKDRGFVVGAHVSKDSNAIPLLTMKAATVINPETAIAQYTAAGGVVQVSRSYTYKSNTIPGDCGSVVYVEDKSSPEKVAGIHISFNTNSGRGRCTQILQQDINEAQEQLGQDYPQGANISAYERAEGFDDVDVGFSLGEFIMNNNTYSYYEEVADSSLTVTSGGNNSREATAVAGKIAPVITAPSRMRPFYRDGVRVDPLEQDMSKGDVPAYNHNNSVAIEEAIASIDSDFRKARVENEELVRSYPPRELTNDEVLNGVKDTSGVTTDWYGPINMNTASGYPYTQQSLSKKDLIIRNQQGSLEMGERVAQEFKLADEELHNGEGRFCVFTPALKDEIRPIEKVKVGKTRVFQVSNLVFCLLVRKYFGMLVAACMALHNDFDVSVGINPFGDDWSELATKLHIGDRGYSILAGDHSSWDKLVTKQEGMWFAEFAKRFYPKRLHQVIDTLCLQVFSGYYVIGTKVYRLSGGMPSGVPITSVANSIINSILLRVILFNAVSIDTARYYLRNGSVRFRVYGDDHMICVPDCLRENFNMHVIQRYLEGQGKKYTNPRKTGELPKWLETGEITYLKRSFVNVGHKWLAPLELDVIVDILNWKMKTIDTASALTASFESFIIELSQHDQDTFDDYTRKGVDALRDVGVFVDVESYDRLQMTVGQTAGLLMYTSEYTRSRNIIMTSLREHGRYVKSYYDYHLRDFEWCSKREDKFACNTCHRSCIVINDGVCAKCSGISWVPDTLYHYGCSGCRGDLSDPVKYKEGGPGSYENVNDSAQEIVR